MSTENERRASARAMLVETLSAPDGAGSDLECFHPEDGSEWAWIVGNLDLEHLVTEVVSWAEKTHAGAVRYPAREPSAGSDG